MHLKTPAALASVLAVVVVTSSAAGGSPGAFHPIAKLTGSAEIHRGELGWSVALTADGNIAAVSAPNDNSPTFDSAKGVLSQGLGAVWIFRRASSVWKQQGPKLVGRGEIGPGQFGDAIALSATGTTLLVGAPADGGGAGAAWVFVRHGSTWAQQGPKLVLPGHPQSAFGTSVALSASGAIALIGGSFDRGGAGAAWVFRREGSHWAQEAKLTAAAETGTGQFGHAVALSGSGTIALVGAPDDDNGRGAAWAFASHGSHWNTLGGRLTPSRATGPPGFGHSVSLSSAGTTAAIGGPVDANGAGAAWLFALQQSSWSPGPKLTGEHEAGPGQFGDSVALSADGKLLLTGGATDAGNAGAAWAFGRKGDGWSAAGSKLVAASGSGKTVEYGAAVALGRNGGLALVGGLGAGDFVGAAWLLSSA